MRTFKGTCIHCGHENTWQENEVRLVQWRSKEISKRRYVGPCKGYKEAGKICIGVYTIATPDVHTTDN